MIEGPRGMERPANPHRALTFDNTAQQQQFSVPKTVNLPLPFITERVGFDFLSHPLLVERTKLLFIVDFDQFLTPRGRVAYVKLQRKKIGEFRCSRVECDIHTVELPQHKDPEAQFKPPATT